MKATSSWKHKRPPPSKEPYPFPGLTLRRSQTSIDSEKRRDLLRQITNNVHNAPRHPPAIPPPGESFDNPRMPFRVPTPEGGFVAAAEEAWERAGREDVPAPPVGTRGFGKHFARRLAAYKNKKKRQRGKKKIKQTGALKNPPASAGGHEAPGDEAPAKPPGKSLDNGSTGLRVENSGPTLEMTAKAQEGPTRNVPALAPFQDVNLDPARRLGVKKKKKTRKTNRKRGKKKSKRLAALLNLPTSTDGHKASVEPSGESFDSSLTGPWVQVQHSGPGLEMTVIAQEGATRHVPVPQASFQNSSANSIRPQGVMSQTRVARHQRKRRIARAAAKAKAALLNPPTSTDTPSAAVAMSDLDNRSENVARDTDEQRRETLTIVDGRKVAAAMPDLSNGSIQNSGAEPVRPQGVKKKKRQRGKKKSKRLAALQNPPTSADEPGPTVAIPDVFEGSENAAQHIDEQRRETLTSANGPEAAAVAMPDLSNVSIQNSGAEPVRPQGVKKKKRQRGKKKSKRLAALQNPPTSADGPTVAMPDLFNGSENATQHIDEQQRETPTSTDGLEAAVPMPDLSYRMENVTQDTDEQRHENMLDAKTLSWTKLAQPPLKQWITEPAAGEQPAAPVKKKKWRKRQPKLKYRLRAARLREAEEARLREAEEENQNSNNVDSVADKSSLGSPGPDRNFTAANDEMMQPPFAWGPIPSISEGSIRIKPIRGTRNLTIPDVFGTPADLEINRRRFEEMTATASSDDESEDRDSDVEIPMQKTYTGSFNESWADLIADGVRRAEAQKPPSKVARVDSNVRGDVQSINDGADTIMGATERMNRALSSQIVASSIASDSASVNEETRTDPKQGVLSSEHALADPMAGDTNTMNRSLGPQIVVSSIALDSAFVNEETGTDKKQGSLSSGPALAKQATKNTPIVSATKARQPIRLVDVTDPEFFERNTENSEPEFSTAGMSKIRPHLEDTLVDQIGGASNEAPKYPDLSVPQLITWTPVPRESVFSLSVRGVQPVMSQDPMDLEPDNSHPANAAQARDTGKVPTSPSEVASSKKKRKNRGSSNSGPGTRLIGDNDWDSDDVYKAIDDIASSVLGDPHAALSPIENCKHFPNLNPDQGEDQLMTNDPSSRASTPAYPIVHGNSSGLDANFDVITAGNGGTEISNDDSEPEMNSESQVEAHHEKKRSKSISSSSSFVSALSRTPTPPALLGVKTLGIRSSYLPQVIIPRFIAQQRDTITSEGGVSKKRKFTGTFSKHFSTKKRSSASNRTVAVEYNEDTFGLPHEEPTKTEPSVSRRNRSSDQSPSQDAPVALDAALDEDSIPVKKAAVPRQKRVQGIIPADDVTGRIVGPSRPTRRKKASSEQPDVLIPNDDIFSEITVAPKPRAPRKQPARPKRKATGTISEHFIENRVDRRPPAGTSSLPVPPLDAPTFGIIQESLRHNPFHLLIAVSLLNKTTGRAAIPVFRTLVARYPTAPDLASADPANVRQIIQTLGLQNNRTKSLLALAKAWLATPPVQGTLYRCKDYPARGDGRASAVPRVVERDMAVCAGALEIGHLPGCGAYAFDSWRIFCRDELRGVGEGFVEAEWKRVVPGDKELRAFLGWMWMREGWVWDGKSGEKRRATEGEMEKAREGEVEEEDLGLELARQVSEEMPSQAVKREDWELAKLEEEYAKVQDISSDNILVSASVRQTTPQHDQERKSEQDDDGVQAKNDDDDDKGNILVSALAQLQDLERTSGQDNARIQVDDDERLRRARSENLGDDVIEVVPRNRQPVQRRDAEVPEDDGRTRRSRRRRAL